MQTSLDGTVLTGLRQRRRPHSGGNRQPGRLKVLGGSVALALAVFGAAPSTAFAAQRRVAAGPVNASRARTKDQGAKADAVVDIATVAKFGKILVDQAGLPLYYDTGDKPPAHFACTGGCLVAWPPLVLGKGQSKPVAGKGVTGLGVVKAPAGEQVTWHGKPLYTFVRDSKDKVLGQGIVQDGTWYVVQPGARSAVNTGSKASSSWG